MNLFLPSWTPILLCALGLSAQAVAQQAPAPSPVLPAELQAAAQARLQAAWTQLLPAAQRAQARLQVQFTAPRGAAHTPCPEGWTVPAVELHSLTRASIPVRCGSQRGSVVAQLQASAPVWTLRSDVPAGQALQAEDLELRPQTLAHRNELLDTPAPVGQQLKTAGRAGQALQARQLLSPVAMRKGDKIEIRAQGDGVQVSVMGLATGSGKLGDTVTVRNARTGRPVKGQLIAPGVLLAAPQAPGGGVKVKAMESGD
ncbi:flagellar basal body P-ring formation chaperone FlgA [Comamonas terrigena]|uniref:flagellar basal body P-ring formation chaperone FlgA n=1 Tax=Comamonas terrigena TaxID=32013 RepID=UPI00244BBDAB|nr:flagellar basal body P-ring formation chaperone FlgA [Comamonas terrigena]MDH1703082.1 flagellar basal body P-ring formation chaperone FlgA [Comamonas terrigena]